MNADKCIGFCIEEDGGFVGMYELVVNDKVQRENINSINYFRDDKLVQQAIMWQKTMCTASRKHGICSAATGQAGWFIMF